MSPADNKETGLGSSNQEAFPSAGKNNGIVIVSCSLMEVCPHSCFGIFLRFLGVICYDRWVLNEGHYFTDCCLVNSQPTVLFLRVVFATFLLVCFLCLKDNTFDKRKYVFFNSLRKLSKYRHPFLLGENFQSQILKSGVSEKNEYLEGFKEFLSWIFTWKAYYISCEKKTWK